MKNILAAVVNGVAAVVFIVVADVDWLIVALIAVGSVVGAQVGRGPGRPDVSGASCARRSSLVVG